MVVALNFVKPLATVALAGFCVAAIGYLQRGKLSELKALATQTQTAEFYQQGVEREQDTLDVLKLAPSFGFDNMVANATFLMFLQYFGDSSARGTTGYALSPDFFDVIINRDPRFVDSYIFLSASSSVYAGRADRTVALIEQGLQSLSPEMSRKVYYIWMYKATDELLFLGNTQAARRSYQTAAEWASFYNDEESQRVAATARRTANFLASNPNSKRAQASAWLMVFQNAVDLNTQKLAISRIQSLGGTVNVTPSGELQIELPEID